jgi:hypothetical protein
MALTGQVDLPVVADDDVGTDSHALADFPVGGVQRPGVPGELPQPWGWDDLGRSGRAQSFATGKP